MSAGPNDHGKWEVQGDTQDKGGPPPCGFRQCSYCGSLSPQDFLALIRTKGVKVGGSDWKYGWPHKLYVFAPNPNPTEQRQVGYTIQNGAKSDFKYGTYPTLHLKFYTEHLAGWDKLEDPGVRAEIKRACGIYFSMGAGKLHFRAPYHGYQHNEGR